jgi:alpha-amylase
MRTTLTVFPLLALIIFITASTMAARPFQEDIFYQIFPISFRDSDGDGIGDFNGIAEAIPYLQSLNVTGVWMNPVFIAKTYHGYQYARNDSINPRFGTEEEFIQMVEAMHDAGIEVYIDLVAYGVGHDHPFFQDAYGNPASFYDPWFAFTNTGNTSFYHGFIPLYTDWEGNYITFVFWDLNHQPVIAHLVEKLSCWLDPNEDGDFHDGIDGFRIDHLSAHNYDESVWGYDLPFWDQLTAGLRGINPQVRFIAEHYDWGAIDTEIFEHGIDAGFAILIMFGFHYLLDLQHGWDLSLWMFGLRDALPDHGQWMGILNNHDVARACTELGDDPDLCRLAAVWLFTSPFPPVMYYGEEIGMRGHRVDWYGNDANDLHVREPFEWKAVLTTPPHANWFGGHPQYSANQFIQDNDGISVEEQDADSASLLNHYRDLAALRTGYAPLKMGEYVPVWVGDSRAYSCLRHDDTSSVLVTLNFAEEPLDLSVDFATTPLGLLERTVMDIWEGQSYPDITMTNATNYPLSLDPKSAVILGISGPVDTTEHGIVFQVDLSSWDPPPDLFPPEVRGNKYPLSWYYGYPMEKMGGGLWRAEVVCKGSLHGQMVEYKYKLSGRGFEDHPIGWSPDPNLTFVVDTTQHPQTVQYDGSGWAQPYQSHPVAFTIDLSHWETQPMAYDLELRGDFSPLSWYQGLDMGYQGEGLWKRTVVMTVGQNTWFYYKYKLNGLEFSDHSAGWSPDPNNLVFTDISVDTFAVEYEGNIWDQPYETFVRANEEQLTILPNFRLYQNFPNPFNSTTTFRYYLPKPSHVEIGIYNVRGQLVERLADEAQEPGGHSVIWDAGDLSSGIYFYQIIAGEHRVTGKCLLLR